MTTTPRFTEAQLEQLVEELSITCAQYRTRVAELERMCREREQTIDELSAIIGKQESWAESRSEDYE